MRKGFTLIELLVVIVIIGILAAIALPNYAKVKDRAREAQVKSGVHTIQVALERYATDHPDGMYPSFVYGGDQFYNHGFSQVYCSWPPSCFSICSPGYSYAIGVWIEYNMYMDYYLYCWMPGDPLLFYGVLTQYPRNPFAENLYDPDFYPNMSFAGKKGNLMFDIGFGNGEGPVFVLWYGADEYAREYDIPPMQLPGNFYYHPMFADGESVNKHSTGHVMWIGTYSDIGSYDVNGYVLTGVGSSKNAGDDYTAWQHNIPPPPYSSYVCGPDGYYSYEWDEIGSYWIFYGSSLHLPPLDDQPTGTSNPAWTPGTYPTGALYSGPDHCPDYEIVTVSGGSDNKPKVQRWSLSG